MMSRLSVFLLMLALLAWTSPAPARDDLPEEGEPEEGCGELELEEPTEDEPEATSPDKPADKPADKHAGKTVKNPRFGQKLMMNRYKNAPEVGSVAPGFELEKAAGQGTVNLAALHKDKPAVLIFGSFT